MGERISLLATARDDAISLEGLEQEVQSRVETMAKTLPFLCNEPVASTLSSMRREALELSQLQQQLDSEAAYIALMTDEADHIDEENARLAQELQHVNGRIVRVGFQPSIVQTRSQCLRAIKRATSCPKQFLSCKAKFRHNKLFLVYLSLLVSFVGFSLADGAAGTHGGLGGPTAAHKRKRPFTNHRVYTFGFVGEGCSGSLRPLAKPMSF